jgi:LysR family transcriptional regulator, flagellar master operon regulator
VPAFRISAAPPLTANIGWLGLQHVLENGGSGYFPERIVRPYLKAKRLNLIENAPEFSMPAYVVYPLECDRDLFGSALEIMHRIASPEARMAAGKRSARRTARKGR